MLDGDVSDCVTNQNFVAHKVHVRIAAFTIFGRGRLLRAAEAADFQPIRRNPGRSLRWKCAAIRTRTKRCADGMVSTMVSSA